MDKSKIKQVSKNKLSQEIATRTTDPLFYGALTYLPNPDVILRKMGRTQEVFEAIIADSHVIGELRSARSGFLGMEWRIQAASSRQKDKRALELCQMVLKNRPHQWGRWPDTIWNIAQAIYRGYRVHEVVWGIVNGYQLPIKVIDRPERRFIFTTDNEPRLLTKLHPVMGEELEPYRWLFTRHMPSYENPYGVALLSSCFWPYTFKHSGFKWFTRFCEKYGIPKAIGKVPPGTGPDVKNAMADQLESMIEDAVAVYENDGSVDLMSVNVSGELVHERLINLCNKEMSKALTSQTLATEIQGQGSRAASETHREREESVNESDRQIICDTFNELFAWITEINIPGAEPPVFEFYEEEEARKEWLDVFDKGRNFMNIPVEFAHQRMQIPLPKKNDEILPSANNTAMSAGSEFSTFSDNEPMSTAIKASEYADTIVENMVDKVKDLLFSVNTLDEFEQGLAEIYPDLDESKLAEMTSMALMTGQLEGYQ